MPRTWHTEQPQEHLQANVHVSGELATSLPTGLGTGPCLAEA